MLVAAERTQAKENCHPTSSVVVQVERKFQFRGFAVLLSSETVNRYIRNDMAGSTPLSRGFKGIVPKAVFKLLVLAVESFIKIKQLNCEVLVRKHLMVIVKELCGIKSTNHINKNMWERVMRSTTVSLDVTVTPAVEERRLLLTTYDNLHMWCMSFKESLMKSWQTSERCISNLPATEGDGDLGNPARWTEANEEALIALRDAPIEIGDTAYGRYKAQKKGDVKTAYQTMSTEEKESLKRELAEID